MTCYIWMFEEVSSLFISQIMHRIELLVNWLPSPKGFHFFLAEEVLILLYISARDQCIILYKRFTVLWMCHHLTCSCFLVPKALNFPPVKFVLHPSQEISKNTVCDLVKFSFLWFSLCKWVCRRHQSRKVFSISVVPRFSSSNFWATCSPLCTRAKMARRRLEEPKLLIWHQGNEKSPSYYINIRQKLESVARGPKHLMAPGLVPFCLFYRTIFPCFHGKLKAVLCSY